MTATPELRHARSCYDHLAGQFGCWLTDQLLCRDALLLATERAAAGVRRAGTSAEPTLVLGPSAAAVFGALGVDLAPSSRPLVRGCLDWTERRAHLAGALGARLLVAVEQAGWVRRLPGQRALQVPEPVRAELLSRLPGRAG